MQGINVSARTRRAVLLREDVAKALAAAAVTEGGRQWLELLQGGRCG